MIIVVRDKVTTRHKQVTWTLGVEYFLDIFIPINSVGAHIFLKK